MAVMTCIVAAIAIAIALLTVNSNFERLKVLFDQKYFVYSLIFVVLVVGSGVIAAGAQTALDRGWAAYEADQRQAREAAQITAEKEKHREETERRAREKKRDEDIALLKRELGIDGATVDVSDLDGGNSLVMATGPSQQAGLPTQQAKGYVLGGAGEKRLFFVIQFFKDSAFWRFNDDAGFETQRGTALNFSQDLKDAKYVDSLRGFEFVVGIGLASHSRQSAPDLSLRRASTLCGMLFGSITREGKPRALGLALGDYQGLPIESQKSPERRQRSIAIAGVTALAPDVSEQALLLEILRKVQIPSVDLLQYSGISGASNLVWVETRRCEDVFQGRQNL